MNDFGLRSSEPDMFVVHTLLELQMWRFDKELAFVCIYCSILYIYSVALFVSSNVFPVVITINLPHRLDYIYSMMSLTFVCKYLCDIKWKENDSYSLSDA